MKDWLKIIIGFALGGIVFCIYTQVWQGYLNKETASPRELHLIFAVGGEKRGQSVEFYRNTKVMQSKVTKESIKSLEKEFRKVERIDPNLSLILIGWKELER